MIRLLALIAALLLSASSNALAQTDDDWALTEVTITKEMPGPAMWRVVKDDKVVWIIGTTYIRNRADWDTRRIDKLLTGAGTLYLPPIAVGKWSAKRYLEDKDLPGNTTLKDVIPPDDYRRFRETAKRYRLGTSDIERDKPYWAGMRLMGAFDRKYGYGSDAVVKTLGRKAKSHKVKIARVASYDIEPFVAQVKALDGERERHCLMEKLDSLDYNAAVVEKTTAAWVQGDVAQLKLIVRGAPKFTCLGTLSDALTVRSAADTTSVIEQALAGDRRSVLILPLYMLIGDDRLIADLRRSGFQVREPR